MTFDPTISLAAVLNLVGFLVGGIAFAVTLRGEIRALVDRVVRLETHSKAMEEALVMLARQDERLTSHARRIEQLETRHK